MKRPALHLIIGIFVLACACAALADALPFATDTGTLPYLKTGKCYQISSYDAAGGGLADYRPIPAGKSLTLAEVQGPGRIMQIFMTLSSSEAQVLRTLVLRIYWDGETSPSVECPIGDFFGVGFGQYVPHSSLLIGMTSGGFWCNLPMPFAKSAKVEVANEGQKNLLKLFYHVEYRKLDKAESGVGYLHTQFRRENPCADGAPYTILEAEGRGQYIGCVLNMQGLKNGLGFMEGNEMFWVDGEKEPSWVGTGTEDLFLGGWYFDRGPFSAPYTALTIMDRPNKRVSAYRFNAVDPVSFEKSIRMTIEHGRKNAWPADYSSVAYWYQTEPHSTKYAMPGVDKRLVTDFVETVPIPGRITDTGRRIKPALGNEAAPKQSQPTK